MLYTWVLRWDLLKPMQIPTHPNTRLLKPTLTAAKESLATSQINIAAEVNQAAAVVAAAVAAVAAIVVAAAVMQ